MKDVKVEALPTAYYGGAVKVESVLRLIELCKQPWQS